MISRGDVTEMSVRHIHVPKRMREPTAEAIDNMRESIRKHGLLTPIGVQIVDEMVINGRTVRDKPVLVWGATRLAAVKIEGWEEIDVQIVSGLDVDFRIAEIVENLHRSELTVLQAADQTAELVRLYAAQIDYPVGTDSSVSGQLDQKPKPGRPPGGIARAARELKKPGESDEASRSRIRRNLDIASISDEAKTAVREHGLENNQQAQLAIAAEPTPGAQVKKTQEIAIEKSKPRQSRVSSPEDRLSVLEKEWDRADPETRQAFRAYITEEGPPASSVANIGPDVAVNAVTVGAE
jgi:hypothetical protein